LRIYKEADPPPKRQLALPTTVFRWLAGPYYSSCHPNSSMATLVDLIILAFFFLLRVGEYIRSAPAEQLKKRTIPLRKQDVRLWAQGILLDNEAELEVLNSANKVSIALANQKNGTRGQWITHSSTGDPVFCPVRVAARRLDHLRTLPSTTPLCTWRTPDGSIRELRPQAVKPLVQLAAVATGLTPDKGYDTDYIGSHSIRASGAMSLKLNGVDDTLIQLLGRWSSDTFKKYIRPQISNLTEGLAELMTTALEFHYTG
jgi:hypothetical protein